MSLRTPPFRRAHSKKVIGNVVKKERESMELIMLLRVLYCLWGSY